MRSRFLLALAALVALALAGCNGQAPLLTVEGVGPPDASPEMREVANRLSVAYRLAEPSAVSASIVAADGAEWPLHERADRPVRGSYVLLVDGTRPGPGPNERQVLPDGAYRVRLRAESARDRYEVELPYRVQGADTEPPAIEDLTVFPDRISPNFDARDDITRITYRLSKPAQTTTFVDRVLDDGTRRRAWTGERRRAEAGEQRTQWDGTQAGQPLPDGTYELGVRAEDRAGNITEARRPLVVEAGGLPEAKIIWARITPRQVIRGDAVCLDAIVRNTGQTVLRTQGPPPDYVYSSLDTFSSIEGHAHVEQAGLWRIGLDWAGSADTAGSRFPYRWGLGRDLAPGEEASIRGCVRVRNENTKMVFYGALIQENVAIHDSGVGLVEVRVSP